MVPRKLDYDGLFTDFVDIPPGYYTIDEYIQEIKKLSSNNASLVITSAYDRDYDQFVSLVFKRELTNEEMNEETQYKLNVEKSAWERGRETYERLMRAHPEWFMPSGTPPDRSG